MNIALAFSGGGVRATVFHLGVLARLARLDLLHRVKTISSVSGGSLAAGLVFSRSGLRWPSAETYLHDVVPQIHDLMTGCDLQRRFILRSLANPWKILRGRASVLGEGLRRHWQIDGRIADLPISPRWLINATCYQTGKNWRFARDLMGDYQTKYVTSPNFGLADALAASAAVPGLVGPLIVPSHRYDWSERGDDGWRSIEPRYKHLHLWDGGVYDNLGVEALFKPGDGLQEGADFLIACDASRPLGGDLGPIGWRPGYLAASLRLVDVATDQVRSLRARMLIEYFKANPGSGTYMKIGRPSRGVGAAAMLRDHEVLAAASMGTTLRRLSHDEFSLLFRHGYEVAAMSLAKHGEALVRRGENVVRFRAA